MQPSPRSVLEQVLDDFGADAPKRRIPELPWLRAALLLLALACFFQRTVCAQVKEVRRVLIFYELGLSSPGVDLVDRNIRDALQNSTYQIELYREYLETTLFPASAAQQEIRQWYVHKYRDIKPDLIITAGPSPLRFLLDSHEQSFRGVPIVFCGTSEELADYPQLDSHFTGVWEKFEPAKTLLAAWRLQPGTKHVVVIGGATSMDRHLEALVKKELANYESKFDITYLTNLTMPELLEKLNHLPNQTVVLLTDVAEDAAGTKFVDSTQSAPMVSRASNAPVFSLGDVDLGHGEVGGDVTSFAKEGQLVAEIALRILKGERVQDIPIVRGANVYLFDWRALRHWGLDETRLPVGSVVLNKPLNVWEAYKRYIIAGSGLLLVQALIIVGLLWQRASRRKAEAALRESEGRFRLVANTAPVMIWMSGKDRRCTYFNQPWLAFTGRSLEQELGDGWTEGIHPEDAKVRLDDFTVAFGRREPFQIEYRLRRNDGEYRWIFDYGVPRFNADGSFAGYIGSAADVTERKRAEEALSTVSRRLIEAQEEERSWIARELHDDINQRIAMVSINLESLHRDFSSSEAQATHRIEETERQLKELGNDIHALSHRLHSSKLDILGLAAACRGFCRELSQRHGVAIEFCSENIPKNLSNEISLCVFRVAQEALLNAVKHSGEREFQVWLNGDASGIELTVHDSGSGFDPEKVAAGHGLGLTSMRERLKLVDGRLSIDSKPGRGTTIRARVPLSPETMAAAASEGRQSMRQHFASP